MEASAGLPLCSVRMLVLIILFFSKAEKLTVKIRGSCRNDSLTDLKLNVFHLTFPCNSIVPPKPWNHELPAADASDLLWNPVDRGGKKKKHLNRLSASVNRWLQPVSPSRSPSALDCSLSATWTCGEKNKKHTNVFLLFLLRSVKCVFFFQFLARLITKNHCVVSKHSVQ